MSLDVDDLKQQVRDRAQQITEDAVQIALESVKAACPVGEGSHGIHMVDTIDAEPVTETAEGKFTTKIVVGAEYAEFTDTGSAGHIIPGSPVLSFATPEGWSFEGSSERDVLAFRSVEIPAIPGQNWFSEPMADVWDAATAEASG
jgi:hypothetical protein